MSKAGALLLGILLAIVLLAIGCVAAFLVSFIFSAWMSPAAAQIAVLVTLLVFFFFALRGLIVTH